jgi:HlyD family secretion protein
VKPIRIVLTALALCSILVFTAGCNKEKAATETEADIISTIQRGDLSLDISAVGNLALSEKENLSFALAGTVKEVLVEEGDYVNKGEILAKLDTSDREDNLKTLTRTIETKDQALIQAEINLKNAEDALAAVNSQAYADQKIAQAELDVANNKITLANAQDAYDFAKSRYDYNWTVPENIRNYEQKQAQLAIAKANLANTENTLAAVSGNIELERETKEKELAINKSRLEDAQLEMDNAKDALAEAEAQSWDIIAPYDCFISKVSISEGSEVQKNTNAIEIADPNNFETDVYVSEMDIFNVSVGIPATVQVDAAQTIILPAEVEKIAPTATIQSGVVNYSVIIRILSTNAITTSQQMSQGIMQQAANATASGELPDMLKRAVESGRMTQEQADKMAENIKSGNFPARPGNVEGEVPATSEGTEGGIPAMPGSGFQGIFTFGNSDNQTQSTSSQLREGLTVTVSITTDTRTNVILVPSAAIHTTNNLSYVTVVSADDTREERQIEIGLNDWQNTEILNGLTEGEQVLVPQGTTTTSDNSNIQPIGGGFMIRDEIGR